MSRFKRAEGLSRLSDRVGGGSVRSIEIVRQDLPASGPVSGTITLSSPKDLSKTILLNYTQSGNARYAPSYSLISPDQISWRRNATTLAASAMVAVVEMENIKRIETGILVWGSSGTSQTVPIPPGMDWQKILPTITGIYGISTGGTNAFYVRPSVNSSGVTFTKLAAGEVEVNYQLVEFE